MRIVCVWASLRVFRGEFSRPHSVARVPSLNTPQSLSNALDYDWGVVALWTKEKAATIGH